ncbi:MAG: hypothetical protein OEO17_05830 [Gemmatimonadota bacterium]|nr:hypothetical protein [Gemmatimonadota bacterium]
MGPGISLGTAALLLIAAMVIFRVVVRRDYRGKGRLTPFSSFLERVIFTLWASFMYLGLPAGWPASRVSPIVRVIAWISFAGGAAIVLIAFARLGVRRAHGLEANVLRQSGLYGVTKNPQIVGLGLLVVASTVLWPSWHAVVSVVLYAAIAHVMVLTEEEHLRERCGNEYARYWRQVPRYLGIRQPHS